MSEELNEIERALTALSPAAPRLDRDALMYEAGRGSWRRRWLWPAAACGFAVLAAGLGVRLATRTPDIVERVVVVREQPDSNAAEPPATNGSDSPIDRDSAMNEAPDPALSPYLRMEREILRHGDLPAPPGANYGVSPLPSLDRELDLPPERLRALHLSPTS